MCGRYSIITSLDQLQDRFLLQQPHFTLANREEVTPGGPALAVLREGGRDRTALRMLWGITPAWMKTYQSATRPLINARCETLDEKPTFKESFQTRRCLIPATAFVELQRGPGGTTPHVISLQDLQPFAMAGLWTQQRTPKGRTIHACLIITTPANEVVQPIHHRMPAILHPQDEAAWLDPKTRTVTLKDMLRPLPSTMMTAKPA